MKKSYAFFKLKNFLIILIFLLTRSSLFGAEGYRADLVGIVAGTPECSLEAEEKFIGEWLSDVELPDKCSWYIGKKVKQEFVLIGTGADSKKQQLGKAIISWTFNNRRQTIQGCLERLEVTCLRVRGIGLGQQLFNLAMHQLINNFRAQEIEWTAQPLDGTISLEELIGFYTKLGGELICYNRGSVSAQMRLSKKALLFFRGKDTPPLNVRPDTGFSDLEIVQTLAKEFHLRLERPSLFEGRPSWHMAMVARERSIADGVKSWEWEDPIYWSILGRDFMLKIQPLFSLDNLSRLFWGCCE